MINVHARLFSDFNPQAQELEAHCMYVSLQFDNTNMRFCAEVGVHPQHTGRFSAVSMCVKIYIIHM